MLEDLYREVIIDHSKHPRHLRELADATHRATGYNPLCGDSIQVWLLLQNDEVRDATFKASGCAISVASASMMCDELSGKNLSEARALAESFRKALVEGNEQDLGSLEALRGVREYPMRVKCATLPWHTMLAALNGQGAATTE